MEAIGGRRGRVSLGPDPAPEFLSSPVRLAAPRGRGTGEGSAYLYHNEVAPDRRSDFISSCSL
jgi:hypothetical protein